MSNCKCEMCSDCFDGLKAQLAAEKARADAAEAALEDQRRALGVVQRSHLDDAHARADDLSRMVAAMGEAVAHAIEMFSGDDGGPIEGIDWSWEIGSLRAILSRPDVAAERGRWVLKSEHERLMEAENDDHSRTIEACARAAEQRDEWKARAESAELGCDIAYRREPTQEEGDAHEDKQHQSMGPDLPTGECFVAMGGWTGRRCRHCARWVWGGPTACAVCVERASRDELGIQLAACQERLRLAMAAGDALRVAHKVIKRAIEFADKQMHDLARVQQTATLISCHAFWRNEIMMIEGALAALDAVPGDALKQVGTIGGTPVYVDPNLPEHDPWTAVSGDALATSTPTLNDEVANLRRVCAEVDEALGNMGLAEIAVLTRARLRGAAGLAEPPSPETVETFKRRMRGEPDIGPALDRAHEASGVVTGAPFDEPQNGVKGVE